MLKGEKLKYEEPDAAGKSKAEIKEMLTEGFDEMITTMKALSEEELNEKMPFYNELSITKAQVIIFAMDHLPKLTFTCG